MKKKIISLLTAVVMIITLVPFEAFAGMRPMEETGSTGSEEPGETSPGEGTGSGEDTGSGEESEAGQLLKAEIYNEMHPTHLKTGEIHLEDAVASDAGHVSYAKKEVSTSGSVKVSQWSVSNSGVLTFTCSSGKDGDVITFLVDISSSEFASQTLTVKVELGYKQLMITSGTTVTYGGKLTLSCVGMKGNGEVIYAVVDGSGKATVSGNVLTAVAAGTVKVTAIQLKDGDLAAEPSEPVTITVTKATPTGSPSFTKLTHAGLTLADAKLTLNSFSVEGRVEWVLSDETIVVANTAYEWVFTPSDTQNYESIRGTVTPYTVNDKTFAVGEGVTEENPDGSFTTITFGEDDSSYKLTEYPDGKMILIHTTMDGTVTTTEKLTDGTRTETVVKKDGSKQVTATDKSGITYTTMTDRYGYAAVQVYLPQTIIRAAIQSNDVIVLPIPEIPCTDDRSDAPGISFTLYTTEPVRISIPVNSPTAGTVVITVAKNGQESIVKTSTVGYDSVEFTLSGSTTIKVADLSKRFTDVDRRHWYKDAVDFATSRGLFNGVTPFEFNASGYMSRAMLVQVLHNLEGNPYYGYGGYYGYAKLLSDVEGKWYENSAVWAIVNGYISGYEDGTFRGELNITREQLAVILYRYAGYPPVKHYVNVSLSDYLDYQSISPYAYEAMYWALCSGVLYTAGRDKLSPQQPVTRAEVAQTFKNLVEFMVK